MLLKYMQSRVYSRLAKISFTEEDIVLIAAPMVPSPMLRLSRLCALVTPFCHRCKLIT